LNDSFSRQEDFFIEVFSFSLSLSLPHPLSLLRSLSPLLAAARTWSVRGLEYAPGGIQTWPGIRTAGIPGGSARGLQSLPGTCCGFLQAARTWKAIPGSRKATRETLEETFAKFVLSSGKTRSEWLQRLWVAGRAVGPGSGLHRARRSGRDSWLFLCPPRPTPAHPGPGPAPLGLPVARDAQHPE
jgi:hypothetical protein